MIKENNKNHEKMYDLIFMDNNMPIMDGYQSTRNIKEFIKNNHLKDIPIIGLTAYNSNENKQKCL